MLLKDSIRCAGTADAIRQGDEYTPRCLEVLREQESMLCYEQFGSREALLLGNTREAKAYDREISVRITREKDGTGRCCFSI